MSESVVAAELRSRVYRSSRAGRLVLVASAAALVAVSAAIVRRRGT